MDDFFVVLNGEKQGIKYANNTYELPAGPTMTINGSGFLDGDRVGDSVHATTSVTGDYIDFEELYSFVPIPPANAWAEAPHITIEGTFNSTEYPGLEIKVFLYVVFGAGQSGPDWTGIPPRASVDGLTGSAGTMTVVAEDFDPENVNPDWFLIRQWRDIVPSPINPEEVDVTELNGTSVDSDYDVEPGYYHWITVTSANGKGTTLPICWDPEDPRC